MQKNNIWLFNVRSKQYLTLRKIVSAYFNKSYKDRPINVFKQTHSKIRITSTLFLGYFKWKIFLKGLLPVNGLKKRSNQLEDCDIKFNLLEKLTISS